MHIDSDHLAADRANRFQRRIPAIAITLIVGLFAAGNLLLMAGALL